MIKRIYLLLAFFIICIGCTEEFNQDNFNGDNTIVLTVSNSQMTKATDVGSAYERELNTLDCFFYPKGQTDSPCVFYHRETLNENTSGESEIKIYVVEDAIRNIFPTDNTCDVFVIANLPSDVKPANAIFEKGNIYTRLDSLQSYILKMADVDDPSFVAQYDAIGKPFVMAGQGTALKDSKKNAAGTIILKRAASKVTMSVVIPDYLDVQVTTEGPDGVTKETVRMVPTFENNPKKETMNAAFHNGIYKGYLHKELDEKVDTFTLSTTKHTFTFSKTLPPIKYKNPEKQDLDSIPSRRVYTCDVPFYSYAHEWEKGAVDAAYMTFEMKWGLDGGEGTIPTYDTYYYQILINGAGRKFEPNHWYDMSVHVGVIGSTIEVKPVTLNHLSFYVLEWADQLSDVVHPEEDVHLSKYIYLNVNTPILELDNVITGNISYDASHTIAWEVVRAYDINNSGDNAVEEDYNEISKDNFEVTRSGVMTYTYDIPSTQYSPIYIYLDVWLDFNENKVYDEDTEKEYLRHIQVIHYPAMYVERDVSCLRSIYVNGARARYTSNSTETTSISGYPLGNINGVRDFSNNYQNVNYSMFIINVSAFDAGDEFQAPYIENGYFKDVETGQYRNGSWSEPTQPDTKGYKYIIGDPRSRSVDNALGGGNNVAGSWAEGRALFDVNGNEINDESKRRLAYYYPTQSEGEAFRVVAPRFRIVSFNNASGKNCTHLSAAMRCASLQEDGFPAGRWRLPTVAEIQYIIMLQEAQAIQPIFTSNGSYYATASYSDSQHSERIAVAYRGDKLSWNSIDNHISVRCVYDDWYWGSDRDAIINTGTEENVTINGKTYHTNKYLFTWGDRKIDWYE